MQPVIERVQLLPLAGREDPRGAQPLIRRLGPVVDAAGARAVPTLAHELLDGLEEIHVQAGQFVDARELRIGGLRGKAIIPDELADDGAVLLLTWALSFFFQGRLRVNVTW